MFFHQRFRRLFRIRQRQDHTPDAAFRDKLRKFRRIIGNGRHAQCRHLNSRLVQIFNRALQSFYGSQRTCLPLQIIQLNEGNPGTFQVFDHLRHVASGKAGGSSQSERFLFHIRGKNRGTLADAVRAGRVFAKGEGGIAGTERKQSLEHQIGFDQAHLSVSDSHDLHCAGLFQNMIQPDEIAVRTGIIIPCLCNLPAVGSLERACHGREIRKLQKRLHGMQ